MAGAATSGVYPVHKNQFKINKSGRLESTGNMVTIADLENFSPSFDNGVEEWTPMNTDGWVRRLMTGKGLTISFTGKRNIGDPGNDYIAGLMFANGQDANSQLEWTFPSGTKVLIDVVINVTSTGGDSTGVDALEFDVMSDGKPTVTPPPAPSA